MEKCYGPAQVLKKPFGLGRGVDITLYNAENGLPVSVSCSFAINSGWGVVYCAATRPEAVDEAMKSKDGCLAGLTSCFKVHPRTNSM